MSREAFEKLYLENVLDIRNSPIGSRDYVMQWTGYQARQPEIDALKAELEAMNDPRRVAACLKACEGLGTEILENIPVPIGAVLAGSDLEYDALVTLSDSLLDAVKALNGTQMPYPVAKTLAAAATALSAELRRAKG